MAVAVLNVKYSLIWLDSTESKSVELQEQLEKLSPNVRVFENEQRCAHFIQSKSKSDRLILITNGRIGEHFVSKIHFLQQIVSIYVYCRHQQIHQQWAKRFAKIKGVVVDFPDLLHRIRIDHIDSHQPDQLLTIYIHRRNPDKSTNDLNGDYLHSQLLVNCLLKMKSNSNDRNEFIENCKSQQKENSSELSLIDEFHREYSCESALWWYTRDSFIYRMLNKALRVQHVHSLYLFRFVIIDMKRQIEKHQCQLPIRVYRSQWMSKDEIEMLEKCLGGYVAINSFFSTSFDYNRARSFVFNEIETNEMQRVFFEIDADPQLENIQPFADISSISYYPDEREVLFMIGSIFRLVDIERNDKEDIWIVRMRLSSLNDYHLEGLLRRTNSKRKSLVDFANILNSMGKFDDAERYYQQYLNEDAQDEKDLSECYSGLGSLAKQKGDYDLSLKYHLKSLEIQMRKSKLDVKSMAHSLSRIGNVYEMKKDYVNALDSYERALEIFQRVDVEDQSSIAMCSNNIGVIYDKQQKYSQALNLYKKALRIWEKRLPVDYHNLGSVHTNIGLTYRRLCQYDLALSHLNLSLTIHNKSRPSQHPSIASTLTNIGLVYEDQSDLKQALSYYEKALIIYRQSLQSTHPYVIDVKKSIRRVFGKIN